MPPKKKRKKPISPTTQRLCKRLSDRLLADAAQRDITATHQAVMIGIDQSALSNIVTLKSVPTMDTLIKIADYLGLSAGELLSDLMRDQSATDYLTVSDRIWMYYKEMGRLLEKEIGSPRQPSP